MKNIVYCLVSLVLTGIYTLACHLEWITKESSPIASLEIQSYILVFAGTFLAIYVTFQSKHIYTQILWAMLFGTLAGFGFGLPLGNLLGPIGAIFIRLLKMIIIPLVFASIIIGVLSLGDVKKIGRIGLKTLAYFTITTMLAIIIGIVLVNLIQPGKYISTQDREKYENLYKEKANAAADTSKKLHAMDLIVNLVPTNPVKSMADGDMLGIIFFAILFGIALHVVEKQKRDYLHKALEASHDAMIQIVLWIMYMAPLGVFCLMVETTAKTGLSFLYALTAYVSVVLLGFLLQIFLVYAPLLYFFANFGLWNFLKLVWPVELMAFSTSSSSATLPVTLRCAEHDLKIPKEIAGFVISLGSTINMNGTALYLGVAVVFIAQVFGVPLDYSQQITILVVATVSAIGTPGIPGGSIVFLSLLLDMVHIPALGIAIVFGVDRILDMFRTTMNVMGDMTAALYIKASETAYCKKNNLPMEESNQ